MFKMDEWSNGMEFLYKEFLIFRINNNNSNSMVYPFQTHYFSESLVAPGIEHRPQDLWPGTLTSRPQRLCIIQNHRENLG
jgi:hypothetical protein